MSDEVKKEKRYVDIAIVNGSEGPSLQICGSDGCGYRAIGPKAYGNVYNKPTFVFKMVDVDELIDVLNNEKWIKPYIKIEAL